MSSIHKSPKSAYWQMVFRDTTGKQYYKSTKIPHTPEAPSESERKLKAAENKRLAKALADRAEEASRGSMIARHWREIAQDVVKRVSNEDLEFASVESYLSQWLNSVEVRKALGTYKRYEGTVNSFLAHLGAKALRPLGDITTQDIESFLNARLQEGRSESTVSTDIKSLNIPFSKALREGVITFNPIAATDKPSAEKETRLPFSTQQLNAIFKAAEGEMKSLCVIGALTGLRLGDVARLIWGSIDYANNQIRLRPQKTQRKKKDITIPIAPQLKEYLLSLSHGERNESPVMPTLANKATSGAHGLSMMFKRVLHKAGIEQERIEASGTKGRTFNRYTFHSFRHTYISALEEAGVPEKARMAIVGHSNEATHNIYTHIKPERLEACLQKLPKLQF